MNTLEKILEKIKELKQKQNSNNQDFYTGYISALSTVEGIISLMDDDDDWIPVSERVPEVQEGTEDDDCPEVVVTIKGADKSTTLKYAPDGTWFDESGEVYKVVSWMPLPEPYKTEEEKTWKK